MSAKRGGQGSKRRFSPIVPFFSVHFFGPGEVRAEALGARKPFLQGLPQQGRGFHRYPPASRLLVVVGIKIIRDFSSGGFPNSFARRHVLERLVEILDAKRQADDEWMQLNGHHSSLRRLRRTTCRTDRKPSAANFPAWSPRATSPE
jgi:hypothetical protein